MTQLKAQGSSRTCNESKGEDESRVIRFKSYMGTLLIGNHRPLGPYSRPMHGVLWWSQGVGAFLKSEVLRGHTVGCKGDFDQNSVEMMVV